MKKTKRSILALLLALALLLPMNLSALAAKQTFADVPDTFWGYEAIHRCADAGIVNGMGNDQFAPDGTLTCAQFYVILCRALFADEVEAARKTDDGWYDAQTRYLASNHYLDYPTSDHLTRDDSTAGLNSGISRYEMALTMYNIVRNMGSYTVSTERTPADMGKIPECYSSAVLCCFQRGLLNGYDDGAYQGEDTVTRAQACTIVCRLLDFLKSETPAPSPEPVSTGSLCDDLIAYAVAHGYSVKPSGSIYDRSVLVDGNKKVFVSYGEKKFCCTSMIWIYLPKVLMGAYLTIWQMSLNL